MKHPGAAYVDIDGQGLPVLAPPGFPGDGLCRYMRCSRSGLFRAGVDGDDNVYEWIADTWHHRGKAFGPRPVIYRGEELLVWRIDSITPPEAKGYRYIAPDGTAVPASPDTISHPTARVWEYTHLPGGFLVGQGGKGADGEDPLIIVTLDGTRRLVKAGQCRFINAYQIGDVIHAGWSEPGGCDSISLPVSEVERLPIAAEPGTEPEPEPEPEPDMDFPAAEWSFVQQMHTRFSGNFPPTEDGARGWTEMTIQQLVHSFPSGGWCWKKSGQSSPPSKDCIARQTGGRFEGWDVLMSAGAQGPKVLATDPAYHDLAGQVPIEVPPVNHLGGVVVVPPPTGTHAYWRDDDERDECNFIMPDGSQCDQPKAAEIHQGVTPPTEPPPIEPPTGSVTHEQIMAAVLRLSNHLGVK